MRIINEVHGDTECPFCGRSLVGKDIKETFIEQGNTEQEAIRKASYYGWTPSKPTNFMLVTGLETEQYDGVTWWYCTECKTAWKRFSWSDKKYLETFDEF